MFQFQVNIFVGGVYEDLRELIMEYENVDLEEFSDETLGIFTTIKDNAYILWVKSLKDTKTVAHEVLHLAICEFRIKGLELNSGSEEALTHIYSWWLDKVLSID